MKSQGTQCIKDFKKYICDVIEHESDTNFDTPECIFKNLTITSSDKMISVEPRNAVNEINAVNITESTVEVLTSVFCDAFPNINVFSANGQGLISVEEKAFRKCKKIQRILLNDNNLTTLPPSTFYSNRNLNYVHLINNHLTKLDGQLFVKNDQLSYVLLKDNYLASLPKILFKNNKIMTILSVRNNQLIDISFLEGMKSLRRLDLSNNNLFDIDVEKLLIDNSKLNTIWLDGNLLWCHRQRKIKEYLKENNISTYIADHKCSNHSYWSTKKNAILRQRNVQDQPTEKPLKHSTSSTVNLTYESTSMSPVTAITSSLSHQIRTSKPTSAKDVEKLSIFTILVLVISSAALIALIVVGFILKVKFDFPRSL